MSHVDHEVARLACENHECAEAPRYLQPLATLGHPKARQLLGCMYAQGLGVPRNDAEATRWFRAAADHGLKVEKGVKQARTALGFKYARGQGVPHDDSQAVQWFRKAADQGSSKACAALAFMYTDGRGVVSAFAEVGEVCKRLAAIEAKMSSEQLARAEQRAEEWKPRQ